ncbi:phosphoglycerate kinase [Candidatus Woesearchaeota archaeon]|nr:phosphoglycerate kinase [Candidatus Woesearchaeota archaeon]
MNYLTLHDINLALFREKYVMVRTSYDVPIDSTKGLLDAGRVRDDDRIKDSLETLKDLITHDCRIIVVGGWIGRPKGEDPLCSMAPVALRLQELLLEKGLLKHPVVLAPNCFDGSAPRSIFKHKQEVQQVIAALKPGQVVLLENVRYDPEAQANDPTFAVFVASLAGNNSLYINDAEAHNHRPEATVSTTPLLVAKAGGKVVVGYKYAKVLKYIGGIGGELVKSGRGPFVFFLSGKKIETQSGITSKITVAHALLEKMRPGDTLIGQGAVTYTLLVAMAYEPIFQKNLSLAEQIVEQYNDRIARETKAINSDGMLDAAKRASALEKALQKEKTEAIKKQVGITTEDIKRLVGSSYIMWGQEGEQLLFATKLLLKAKEKGVVVALSADHVITNKLPDENGVLPADAQIKIYGASTGIPGGWLGVAPGPKTAEDIAKYIGAAKLLILAGPLSIEDKRVEGVGKANTTVLLAIQKATDNGAVTVGAGGDTAAFIRDYNASSYFTVVSNAGGATLELIEQGTSVGLEAVEKANRLNSET